MRKLLSVCCITLVCSSTTLVTARASDTPARVDIPAGELIPCLEFLSRQMSVELIYDADKLRSVRTAGVKGTYSGTDAVRMLLRGTQLELRKDPSGALLIVAPPAHQVIAASEVRLAEVGVSSQPPAPPRVFGAGSDTLQEIIVTATKVAEPLSKVPVSISAYSKRSLDSAGAKSWADVAALTPGVDFAADWFAASLTTIAIRGIRQTLGTAPTTGIYIDDTPVQSRITGNSSLGHPYPLMFDLDRVEVLRGPQGTLFGAGAEAGAIRFITPEPSLTEDSRYARAELGYTVSGASSYEAGAALGGPVIDDRLGFRISAWGRHDGGWVDRRNYLTGELDADANSRRSVSARVAFTYAPTSSVRITPSVLYEKITLNDTGEYWVPLSNPADRQFVNGNVLRTPGSDRFVLPSLKITAALPWADLTSISSYFHRTGGGVQDGTTFDSMVWAGSPYPTLPGQAAPQINDQAHNVFSQELRLASNRAGARLTWVGGLFFSSARQREESLVEDPLLPRLIETGYGLTIEQFLGSGLYQDKYSLVSWDHSVEKQLAAFAHLDYHILDDLRLGVGLRVARTEFSYNQLDGGPILGPLHSYSGTKRATPVTPAINLDYQLTADNMLYAIAAEGYRVGGVNGSIPGSQPCAAALAALGLESAPPTYDSDTVRNYEVGSKGRFFDGRAAMNLSVFYAEWRGIQQSVVLPACGNLGFKSNLGTAVSKGFDLDLQARLFAGLQIGISLGYNDAYYTKTIGSAPAVIVTRGDTLRNTPWIASLAAQYDLPLPGGKQAYLRAQGKYRSHNGGRWSGSNPDAITYDPDISLPPATHVLDLRAGLRWDAFDVSLFVDNALDSHTGLNRAHPMPGDPLFYNSSFRPLTAGLTLVYHP